MEYDQETGKCEKRKEQRVSYPKKVLYFKTA